MYTSFGPGDLGIDLPFPEAAALAADCGFEGIRDDLDYLIEHGPDEYRNVLSERDLRTGSFGLPVSFAADGGEYERDVAALAETAERAAAIGCTPV